MNKIKRYSEYLKERSEYYTPNGSEYDITVVKRDNAHDYKYCDGILYQLSLDNNDIIVNINEIEHTEGNMFYDEQVQQYINYFNNGGIVETFPVQEYPLGVCDNLYDMLEYLDDPDNFDLMWELTRNYKKLYDNLSDILLNSIDYGLEVDLLETIDRKSDLDKYYDSTYGEDDEDLFWDKELYSAFNHILEYWEDNKSYALTDFNHRFQALVKLGKTQVIVDPS